MQYSCLVGSCQANFTNDSVRLVLCESFAACLGDAVQKGGCPFCIHSISLDFRIESALRCCELFHWYCFSLIVEDNSAQKAACTCADGTAIATQNVTLVRNVIRRVIACCCCCLC